jgi:hypothetical protein
MMGVWSWSSARADGDELSASLVATDRTRQQNEGSAWSAQSTSSLGDGYVNGICSLFWRRECVSYRYAMERYADGTDT